MYIPQERRSQGGPNQKWVILLVVSIVVLPFTFIFSVLSYFTDNADANGHPIYSPEAVLVQHLLLAVLLLECMAVVASIAALIRNALLSHR